MVGVDESTELVRTPIFSSLSLSFYNLKLCKSFIDKDCAVRKEDCCKLISVILPSESVADDVIQTRHVT